MTGMQTGMRHRYAACCIVAAGVDRTHLLLRRTARYCRGPPLMVGGSDWTTTLLASMTLRRRTARDVELRARYRRGRIGDWRRNRFFRIDYFIAAMTGL
jgi:hypothetical protein